MRHLARCRLEVLLTACLQFCRCWRGANAACAPVKAGAVVHRRIVDDSPVVRIVNDRCVDAHHRAVIKETSAAPVPSTKADSAIAEAIVDAPVEANMRPPVTSVPCIQTTTIAPITRRPKNTNRWRVYPHARDPVVACRLVAPIARRPHISIPRTNRLRINRKNWRRNRNRHKDASKRLHRQNTGRQR